MKTKEISERIISLYEDPDPANQDGRLALRLIHKLGIEIKARNFTHADLEPILEAAKQIAATKKNMKQILEKDLLSFLAYLPHHLWEEEDGEGRKFERGTKSEEGKIAEALISFAKEIYEIKIDRDAFAGKRRGFSVQILESLSQYVEVPEFMELCAKSIRSKSKNEFLDTVECLKEYYLEKDIVPDEEIVAIIDKRIEKTKNRSEMVGGLNFQVKTGIIGELEALSRLDDWKEKNEQWD